jgi:hypothetical protein
MKILSKPTEGKSAFEHTLGIQIGSVSCELKCRDDEIYHKLCSLYSNYLTDEHPDVTIELESTSKLSPDELRKILERSRYMRSGNNFRTSNRLLKGKYDMASRKVKITGEKALIDPDNKDNLLNQLISVTYYTACRMKYTVNPPAMLVHGCGILRHGQVSLFTGPSDIGKSTIAHLCGDKHGEVLNDEMLLMSRPGGNGRGVTIQNAPILGDLLPGRNTVAPLSRIFMLKQSNRTALKDLDKAGAYLRFIRQIIAPSCVGNYDKKTAYNIMADFGSEVIREIPAYELEFNQDSNALWQITDEIGGTSGKEPPD